MTEPLKPAPHLNAAQVATLDREIRAKIESVIKDVELRKWAADAAMEFAADIGADGPAAVEIAKKLYEFVSVPIAAPMIDPTKL